MVVEGLSGTDSFQEAGGDVEGNGDEVEAKIVDGGVLESCVVGALSGDGQFLSVAAAEDVD